MASVPAVSPAIARAPENVKPKPPPVEHSLTNAMLGGGDDRHGPKGATGKPGTWQLRIIKVPARACSAPREFAMTITTDAASARPAYFA